MTGTFPLPSAAFQTYTYCCVHQKSYPTLKSKSIFLIYACYLLAVHQFVV